MRLRSILAVLAAAVALSVATSAPAQVVPSSNPPAPGAVTVLGASSGSVANAIASAALAATVDARNVICGFSITSTGATAAAVVSVTVTGVAGGTQTYIYATVAGAAVANQSLTIHFNACVPAAAIGTAITVSLPALGAGNTNAAVNVWGYRS